MKIKKVIDRIRYDFSAILQCEHCENEQRLGTGYDDIFYHERVIPEITCKECGKNRSGVIPEVSNDNGLRFISGKHQIMVKYLLK
jgi:hypothetical protein